MQFLGENSWVVGAAVPVVTSLAVHDPKSEALYLLLACCPNTGSRHTGPGYLSMYDMYSRP